MTFDEAKKMLDGMSDEQFDKNCRLLAILHDKMKTCNVETADAIELAAMAMMLYCKK